MNTLEKAQEFLFFQLNELNEEKNHSDQQQIAREILAELGNPQNSHNVIHIAATSGKGTTCYFIDAILRAHDKRTGMMVSPHVYDIRERIQINGQLAAEKRFLNYLNGLIPIINNVLDSGRSIHYFTVMTILGFYIASSYDLDYQVVETGMGGRLDPTNNITRSGKYSVLGQIGLDHTSALGTTFGQIAKEKTGILQANSMATALLQKNAVNEVFAESANKNNVDISWVESSNDYLSDDYMLAIDTVSNIAKRDGWQFDEEVARQATDDLYIPGRFEKRTYKNRQVILDGAHNPQKISALTGRLVREGVGPCTVILALGAHKDYINSLAALVGVTDTLICTEFFNDPKFKMRLSLPADELARSAESLGFKKILIENNPENAFKIASETGNVIVVTGSFYLLGQVDRNFS